MPRQTIKNNWTPNDPVGETDLNNIGDNILYILDENTIFTGDKVFDGGVGQTAVGFLSVRQSGDTANDGITITSSSFISHRIWKNSAGFLGITNSNSEGVYFTSDSNLLINTVSNTGEKLKVNGGKTLIQANSGLAGLSIKRTNSTVGDDIGFIDFYLSNDNSVAKIGAWGSNTTNEGYITFFTRNATESLSEKIRITQAGNLLINTSNDSGEKLKVNGGSVLVQANTGLATYNIKRLNSTEGGDIGSVDYYLSDDEIVSKIASFGNNSTSKGSMAFYTRPSSGALTKNMVLHGTGNLTLGTDADDFSNKLKVNGTADFDSITVDFGKLYSFSNGLAVAHISYANESDFFLRHTSTGDGIINVPTGKGIFIRENASLTIATFDANACTFNKNILPTSSPTEETISRTTTGTTLLPRGVFHVHMTGLITGGITQETTFKLEKFMNGSWQALFSQTAPTGTGSSIDESTTLIASNGSDTRVNLTIGDGSGDVDTTLRKY